MRRYRRGYALLSTMALILILAVLGTAMLGMAGTNLRITSRRYQGAQALNLAMGGLDYAAAELARDADYAGFAGLALGAGTVDAEVSTPAGQPERRVVVATGTVTSRGVATVRRIRAVLDTGKLPPMYTHAFASKKTFTLNGDILVDSYPALNRGHVHSNADMFLIGTGVNILGRATATRTVSVSGDPNVTGGAFSGVPPVAFPEIDDEFKAQALANGTTSGSVTVNDGSLVKGKIIGNLTVKPPLGCSITGVVWVTGNVTISAPVTGNGTIICDGNLDLDAAMTYPPTDMSRLAFITTSSSSHAVDLGGNRQFKGIVYAPYGRVRLHGTPQLHGGIMANEITISGTPNVHRWTAFEDEAPPLPRIFMIRGWQEL